ncbi:hypothetical protein MJN76_33050, partial [Salmonella enterica subsp. enterica serovar Anatum]|nr:hypothetical protein [Salmonella enterica subsp. enterica serovar Anatum]
NNTDAVNVAQLKASEAGSVRYETNADGSVNYSVLNLGDGSGGMLINSFPPVTGRIFIIRLRI